MSAQTPVPGAASQPHDRETIAEAALALIEDEGVGGFSTRRLAARIGLQAMSLYHYFPSRNALLDAVVERMISEIPLPAAPRDWRSGLLHLARDYRGMGHRHIAAAPFLAERGAVSPAMTKILDAIGAFLLDAGLSPPEAALWLAILRDYIVGSLSADYAAFLQTRDGPAANSQYRDKMPGLALSISGGQRAWRNRVFEIGYSALLDAIDRRKKAR